MDVTVAGTMSTCLIKLSDLQTNASCPGVLQLIPKFFSVVKASSEEFNALLDRYNGIPELKGTNFSLIAIHSYCCLIARTFKHSCPSISSQVNYCTENRNCGHK